MLIGGVQKIRGVFVFVAVIAATMNHGSGQTLSASGSWNNASNWTPAVVPAGTGTNVTLNANPTVNAGNTVTIGNITAANGVQITVNSNSILTLGSSALFNGGFNRSLTFNNDGTIQINSGSPDGVLEIWGNLIVNNNLQLQVTGSLIVHGNVTMNNNAQIQVSGGGSVSVGGNVTGGNNAQIQVSGSGSSISITGTLSLSNNGTIQASGGGVISAGGCSCSGCSTQCNVLPITLTDFDAYPVEDKVILTWSTASEINFDYFSVERGSDGISFSEIGQVTGHGTTKEAHTYSFEDQLPLIGKSYYRLTSVDFDRYTESFQVVAVDFDATKAARIFPNPAVDGKVNIELTFEPTDPVRIIFTDLSGVERSKHQMDGRASKISTELAPGTYLVRISSGDFSTVLRVVVR